MSANNSAVYINKGKIVGSAFSSNKTFNPNFLDNGWFTINQRNFTSGASTANQYCVDRWKMGYDVAVGTVNVSAGGILLTPAASDGATVKLIQPIDNISRFVGVSLSASILTSPNLITSGLGTYNGEDELVFISNDDLSLSLDPTTSSFIITAKSALTIKAVKLEIGVEFTLNLDVAPEYESELSRCQLSTADVNDTYANKGLLLPGSLINKLGAKNVLPNTASSTEENSLTITVNSDGSITISGTASADSIITLYGPGSDAIMPGDYKINGSVDSVGLYIEGYSSGVATGTNIVYTGNGESLEKAFSIDYTGSYDAIACKIIIPSGTDLTTPVTIYPMVRDIADNDPTYYPYAKSNLSLTGDISSLAASLSDKVGSDSINNITISTTDLTPGTSPLATGELYLVYE